VNAPGGQPPEQQAPANAILDDDTVVVRYGEMKDYDLTKSVFAEHDDPNSQKWGVSVLCLPNRTALQLVDMRRLKHPSFRVSTVGAIRALGLDVWLDDGDPPHALILYGQQPTGEDWATLRSVFGENQSNPFGEEGTWT
jgi:hypothetical protein